MSIHEFVGASPFQHHYSKISRYDIPLARSEVFNPAQHVLTPPPSTVAKQNARSKENPVPWLPSSCSGVFHSIVANLHQPLEGDGVT